MRCGKGQARASLLLWVPSAFYVYSVAYGSVPTFIPQLWPHSYYNARYGMEMLPALALFAPVAMAAGSDSLRRPRGRWIQEMRPRPIPVRVFQARPLYLAALALAVVNPLAMVYGTALVQKCAGLIEHHPSNLLARYDTLRWC